jgi:hypothetical protein
MAVGTCCVDHRTPRYQQKLILTFPTSGARSVGIVRLQTISYGVYVLCFFLRSWCFALVSQVPNHGESGPE